MLAALVKHEQIVKQCSALAVVGTGALVAKHVRTQFRSKHARTAHTRYVHANNTLVNIVRAFDELCLPDELTELVNMLDDALHITHEHTVNERSVNRFHRAIFQHARNMMERARRSKNASVIGTCIQISQEELPSLEATLDALLHNYILDRD
tara:strand:+ start:1964 stop:2419 length:456 start_codon:yes stop_codon:yes gene_type:complete